LTKQEGFLHVRVILKISWKFPSRRNVQLDFSSTRQHAAHRNGGTRLAAMGRPARGAIPGGGRL